MSDAAARRAVDLLERARRIFPWQGAWGSVLAAAHGDDPYPHFFVRADGARIVDAAGREYLDWYCGGGPVALGHRHPEVQAAMAAQLEAGVNLSGPSALEIEVAERIAALIPGAEQVELGKNGTDATSAAVRLARAVTGRERVLISGYHGFADWSKAARADCRGIPQALRGLVQEFDYNDLDGARRLVSLHGGELAAIVVEPIRDADASPAFLHGLRDLADRCGALLILDEIVTALRVARGGVQELYGVRADLVCLAKSMANGAPLSAVTGPRRFMKHLPSTQFGLTFRRDALSLAAARATLDVHARVDVAGHIARIGEELRAGFGAAAAAAGLDWRLDGHPGLMNLHVTGGGRLTSLGALTLFLELCQRGGLYLEPYRILPSLAHTSADVRTTLAVMGEAMRAVRDAMRDGLHGRLDSPMAGHFEVAAAGAHEPSSRSNSIELACVRAPEALRGEAHTGYVMPASADASVVGGVRLVLRIGATAPDETTRAGLRLGASVGPRFRATARYRFVEPPRGGGFATLLLTATGAADRSWCCVRHALGDKLPALSSSSLGDRYAQVACAYGTHAGALVLTCDGRELRAAHETDRVEPVGEALAVAAQEWHLDLQLEAGPQAGAVTVEVTDVELSSEP